MARRRTAVAVILLAAAFAFRLLYGLSSRFWYEDERQIFLIGLRSFARGEWPYFGADVVWTGGQLPGALQGLLVRWPLAIWPAPESPFVLLNVLSFLALSFFAWYLTRRLPGVPRWLIWTALLVFPWTLNFSTHVINPSYVLAGAVAFFVGFLEGTPALRRGLVSFPAAWLLMGAGLFFVMQLHMSWVLLPPYVLAAIVGVAMSGNDALGMTRGKALARALAAFILGAAITGSTLAPTIVRHGPTAGYVPGTIQFQPQSPAGLVTTTARVLSFASFETNRFLGLSTTERALVLWRRPWILPFAVVVAVAGVLQPLWMLVMMFRRGRDASRDWTHTRVLLGATVLVVYLSFFLSVRGPQAHAFYVVFPVAALFAFSCWQAAFGAAGGRGRGWERVAGVVLAASVVMHAGLKNDRWTRESLYVDRALVAAAIDQRNDRFLGDRRDTLLETQDRRPRPIDRVADPDAFMTAQPMNDLRVDSSTWTPVASRFSSFSATITNTSRVAAWLDIRFASAYTSERGHLLTVRDGVIKQILQPGETRTWHGIADGGIPPGATAATITVIGAERAVPGR